MSKLLALGAMMALAIASSLPVSANHAGTGSAASINRVTTDKLDYFKLDRLRADGSSLILSCIDETKLDGPGALV